MEAALALRVKRPSLLPHALRAVQSESRPPPRRPYEILTRGKVRGVKIIQQLDFLRQGLCSRDASGDGFQSAVWQDRGHRLCPLPAAWLAQPLLKGGGKQTDVRRRNSTS